MMALSEIALSVTVIVAIVSSLTKCGLELKVDRMEIAAVGYHHSGQTSSLISPSLFGLSFRQCPQRIIERRQKGGR